MTLDEIWQAERAENLASYEASADAHRQLVNEQHLRIRLGMIEAGDAGIYHQQGCSPSDDYRQPCGCNALVVEPLVGAVIRPPGVSGCTIADVIAGIGKEPPPPQADPELVAELEAELAKVRAERLPVLARHQQLMRRESEIELELTDLGVVGVPF